MKNKKIYSSLVGFRELRLVFDKPDADAHERIHADSKIDGVDAPEADAAEKKGEVVGAAKKDLIKARTDAELREMAKQFEESRKNHYGKLSGMFSKWAESATLQQSKLNPETWDITKKSGIDQIREEWGQLGIYSPGKFFDELVLGPDALGKSSNKEFLAQLTAKNGQSAEERRKAYSNPEQYSDRLDEMTDPLFAKAYRFFKLIQRQAKQLNVQMENATVNDQEKSSDKFFNEAKKFASENVKAFKDSIKNGDYSTAAIYIAGIYGAYRLWKSSDKANKETISKLIFGSALGYMAYTMDKRTGGRIAEALGFKDELSEVEDSTLQHLYMLDNTEFNDGVDAETTLAMRDENMLDLYNQFEENTNDPKGVPHFIDPNNFVAFADEFSGINPQDLATGKPLSARELKYRDTGKQIYLMAREFKNMYDKFLRPKYNKEFGDLLQEDRFKNTTVLHFSADFGEFVKYLDGQGAEIGKNVSKLNSFMRKRLGGVGEQAFKVDSSIGSGGAFNVRLWNYPAVMRAGAEGYYLFEKGTWEKSGGNPSEMENSIGFIPYEDVGEGKAAVGRLEGHVEGRMRDVLSLFQKPEFNIAEAPKDSMVFEREAGPDSPIKLYFENGIWMTRVKYKAGNIGKKKDVFVDTQVIIDSETGNTLRLETDEYGTIMQLNNLGDKDVVAGDMAISQLIRQADVDGATDFRPLQWLYWNKSLKFYDVDRTNGQFAVKIPGMKEFWIDYRDDKYSFRGTKAQQKKTKERILKSHIFQESIGKSVSENKDFVEQIDRFKGLLKHGGDDVESVFNSWIKKVPNWFTDATLSNWGAGFKLSDWDGSMAENYAISLLHSQQALLSEKVKMAIKKADGWDNIHKEIGSNLPLAIDRLKRINDNFAQAIDEAKLNDDSIDDFSFENLILNNIVDVATDSYDYRSWFKHFSSHAAAVFGASDLSDKGINLIDKATRTYVRFTNVLDTDYASESGEARTNEFDKRRLYAQYVERNIFANYNAGFPLDKGIVPYSSFDPNVITVREYEEMSKAVDMPEYSDFDKGLASASPSEYTVKSKEELEQVISFYEGIKKRWNNDFNKLVKKKIQYTFNRLIDKNVLEPGTLYQGKISGRMKGLVSFPGEKAPRWALLPDYTTFDYKIEEIKRVGGNYPLTIKVIPTALFKLSLAAMERANLAGETITKADQERAINNVVKTELIRISNEPYFLAKEDVDRSYFRKGDKFGDGLQRIWNQFFY